MLRSAFVLVMALLSCSVALQSPALLPVCDSSRHGQTKPDRTDGHSPPNVNGDSNYVVY